MNITVRIGNTTLERQVLKDARHKIDFSTEAVFYEAFPYFWERPVKEEYIQKRFGEYLRSGGELIPEEVLWFCLDVLAGRIAF